MLARDAMSSPVVTVGAWTPVETAVHLLVDNGFTALPVLDEDNRLVGIVTEADLLRNRMAPDPHRIGGFDGRRGQRRPQTVGDVMTTPVESLTPGADVADAAQIMVDERIRCLPIVDGRRVVGVLTRRDLLRLTADSPSPGVRPPRSPLRDLDPDCP